MNVNEKFVVFQNGQPSLYCYVDRLLDNGELCGVVINGGWTFILDESTGWAAWQAPSGPSQARFNCVPMRHLPKPPSGDYNVVLDFIRDSGYVPGKQSKAKLWLLDNSAKLSLLIWRLKKAWGAFVASWSTSEPGRKSSKKEQSPDEQWNDDIPF